MAKRDIHIDIASIHDGVIIPLWKQGEALYRQGAVGEVSSFAKGDYQAEVNEDGSTYHVSLTIYEGELTSHACDCLDHKRYPGLCRHNVALLLKLNEDSSDDGFEGDEEPSLYF